MSERALFYILDENGEERPLGDVLEWGRWFVAADRRVASSDLGRSGEVSTVFLGTDHRFIGGGPAILYETLVFGGPLDGRMKRYCTRAEALAGHEQMVREIGAWVAVWETDYDGQEEE